MAATMSQIFEVWDTGDAQDWYQPGEPGGFQKTSAFLERTGAKRVIRLTWLCNGQTISCPYPATVIPDRSGVVLQDEWHFQGQPMEGPEPYSKHLRVLNPDGTLRLRIYPPRIDEHSKPAESWIECPRNFAERGIPFGCPASDGQYDMVVEYDWQTGKMLRWINAAPWLTR